MPPIPAEQQTPHPIRQQSPTIRDLAHDEAEIGSVGRQRAAKPASKAKGQKPTAPAFQQRQGDRVVDDGGDPTAARLPVFVRYSDLEAAGIATSWMQLRRLIDDEGFPRGIMIGKNTRAWPVRDVEAWLAARPSAPKRVNVEKANATRREKRQEAEARNSL